MRILLSIGCDEYRSLDELTGAAKDATSIFTSLVGIHEHQYDPTRSKLLLSPTAEQLRAALSAVLYDNAEIAVFTLYFAGHAAVFDETLYLAAADTIANRIPPTAIGFPDILRVTAGARPRQANFIIDACNSAGLGFDIGAILKRTIVGNSDTMGISFVASAAANQFAGETSEGGNFTVKFTEALRGDAFIQKMNPFLNLAEISQHVQLTAELEDQTISYWTLNLQGPNLFARNPHFSGPSYVIDAISARLGAPNIEVGRQATDFKSVIAKISNGVDEKTLSRILEDAFLAVSPERRAPLIHGLAEGLRLELANTDDVFLEARVHAVLLGQLLGLCPYSERASVVAEMISWYKHATYRALSTLDEAIDSDRNALLLGGYSDLYELPVRLSDIFGYISLLLIGNSEPPNGQTELALRVIKAMLQRYGNSILALTDEQATGYLLFLELCRQKEWEEIAEEVIGRLYNDLHLNFARCGDYSLNAEKQFTLLRERYEYSFSATQGLYNFPSDLTTVILSFCALAQLDDAIDPTLIEIDHTSVNYFVCENPNRYGLVEDLDGANYTIGLGRDFWCCTDLKRILHQEILPRCQASVKGLSPEDRFCTYAASLALRDRQPWHAIEIMPWN